MTNLTSFLVYLSNTITKEPEIYIPGSILLIPLVAILVPIYYYALKKPYTGLEINLFIYIDDQRYAYVFDLNDCSGRNMFSLFSNTRDILWNPDTIIPWHAGIGHEFNCMCFDLENPLIRDLRRINPSLFNPILFTPAIIYSIPGYNLKDIYFYIPIIAPSYSKWIWMIIYHDLKLYTNGSIIPISIGVPIYLRANFYAVKGDLTDTQMCIRHGIDLNLFDFYD